MFCQHKAVRAVFEVVADRKMCFEKAAMFSFEDMVKNENLDVSQNFCFINKNKILAKHLYKLWNCGVPVLGISTHGINHPPRLILFDEKNGKIYWEDLTQSAWVFWTTLINALSKEED